MVLLNQREPPVSALLTAREELRIQQEGRLGAVALGAGEGTEPRCLGKVCSQVVEPAGISRVQAESHFFFF